MKRYVLAVLLVLSAVMSVAQKPQPTLAIDAPRDEATALSAALFKKHVAVTIVEDKTKADLILRPSTVDSKEESGAGKIARCLFAYCAGINGNSQVAVQLIRTSDSSVQWSYQVKKGQSGPAAIQSLSEAVAKHLNNDYLKKH